MANKSLVAHLESKCIDKRSQLDPFTDKTFTAYHSIIAPTEQHMEWAIKNYASQVGAVEVKTITAEEYDKATNT